MFNKQIKNILFQIHKILGSFLSLIFVIWFLSGIVLIFDGFPHASRQERFLHMEEIKPGQLTNLQPPSTDFKGKVKFELCAGRPVYRVFAGKKKQVVYDAASLKPVTPYTLEQARQLSESYNGSPVKKIEKNTELDSWMPWSYYQPLLPVYKCYMDDAKHTVLYVSEVSGTIVQETNRQERWLARIGAIPHWIYFKQLRLIRDTWRLMVIILSALGLLVSLSGIYVGLIRLRKRKNGLTPYKKRWYKWHHITGFCFGIIVFTFLLSGLISVTGVPDWMVGVDPAQKEKITWKQSIHWTNHQSTTPSAIYKALKRKAGIRQIEWKTVLGQAQYHVYYDSYQVPEVYCLKDSTVKEVVPYSIDEIESKAQKLFSQIPFTIEFQSEYDNYYSASAMFHLPKPVFKIKLEDAAQTWLYINPATGEEVKRVTRNTRLRRWLYRALHTFDFQTLKEANGVRKTILVTLSIGGLVVSVSGFTLSYNWIRRKRKKSAKHINASLNKNK